MLAKHPFLWEIVGNNNYVKNNLVQLHISCSGVKPGSRVKQC